MKFRDTPHSQQQQPLYHQAPQYVPKQQIANQHQQQISQLRLKTQRDRIFELYLQSIQPEMSPLDRKFLDRLFPDDKEYNQVINDKNSIATIHSRIQHTFKDHASMLQLNNLLNISNQLSLKKIPDNMVDALTLLLCERTFLTSIIASLVKQLINKQNDLQPNSAFNNDFQDSDNIYYKGNPLPIVKKASYINQQQQPLQIQKTVIQLQPAKSRIQISNTPPVIKATVIDSFLSGAATLFVKLGQAMSPVAPREALAANVYTNQKYNTALVNKNNQRQIVQKLQLAVDSDSDDSVDVPDSSDDECDNSQSVISNRIIQKQKYVLPIAHRNSKQVNTSTIMTNITQNHFHYPVPQTSAARLYRQRPINHRYISQIYDEDDDVVKMGAPIDDRKIINESRTIPIEQFINQIVNSSPNQHGEDDQNRFTVHHEEFNQQSELQESIISKKNQSIEDHPIKNKFSKIHDNFSSVGLSQQQYSYTNNSVKD